MPRHRAGGLLLRHGPTEWKPERPHTPARTDIPITRRPRGRARAARPPRGPGIAPRPDEAPARGAARETSHELAGLERRRSADEDLLEWNIREYEALTTA